MQLDIYLFTAYDPNADATFTFKAYRLPTGEVLVPAEQTHDAFYADLEEVEGQGEDRIEDYHATGQSFTMSDDDIREAITGAARAFGLEAIPVSLRHWIRP